jgi:CRISPR system Cascade subunit CasE
MTLYLSRLTLDARSVAAHRDLADCHRLHRTLLSAFGQVEARGARERFGLLYRIEAPGGHPLGGRAILAQSCAEPDWGRLPPGYLAAALCKRVDGAYSHFDEGSVLRFRLLANPTKRISAGNPGETERWRCKRVDLRGEEAQVAWLARKAEQAGFAPLHVRALPGVADVRVGSAGAVVGRRDGARLTFGAALFEGRLQVTDGGAFGRALRQGVGSGKAYGFGLLSVAPERGNTR